MRPCGRDHPVQRVDERRLVEPAGHAHRVRQVGRADEQDIHPVDRGDRIRCLHRRERFDLEHAGQALVSLPDLRVRGLEEPAAAVGQRHAPDPGRWEAHPGQRLLHLGDRLEPGDHQPVGAHVQRPADAKPLRGGDPDERRRRRALDREQLGVEIRLRAHAVLEVHDQPVEARPGEQLRARERAEIGEGAEGDPTREHAAAEVGAGGQGRGGRQGGHAAMMPDCRCRREPTARRAARRTPVVRSSCPRRQGTSRCWCPS